MACVQWKSVKWRNSSAESISSESQMTMEPTEQEEGEECLVTNNLQATDQSERTFKSHSHMEEIIFTTDNLK